MHMLLIQLVGLVGVALLIATFQVNKRHLMLRMDMFSGIAWAIHYTLLGAQGGAAINLLMSLRSFLFDRYRKKIWIFWVMIVLYFVAVIATWTGWVSILPLIGSVLGTIAFWQKKPRTIRMLSVIVPISWLTYNVLVNSYPGMLADSIAICSTIVGIYRFDILPLFVKPVRKRRRARV